MFNVLLRGRQRRPGSREATARHPRRFRIAIDMDEVMADALSELLRRYNTAFGANLTPGDVQGRHLEDCVPAAHRADVEAMIDASFFEDLPVMPDCQAVIRELAERHEVFVASAAMDVPCSFDAKYTWLRRHFPFIPPTHIVFCGDKSVVDADYLIDDRARHFARFKGEGLLFSAPHNCHETRYRRVASWKDVRDYFAQLETPAGTAVPVTVRFATSDERAVAMSNEGRARGRDTSEIVRTARPRR